MQWVLQRLAALSGAAEPNDDLDGDEDKGIPLQSWEFYQSDDEGSWEDLSEGSYKQQDSEPFGNSGRDST
jgi:hypothetical protein